MFRAPLRRSFLGLALSLMLINVFVFSSIPSASASGFTFKNFELAAITGIVCPNNNKTCTNGAAEPAIRADKAGQFYATSENGLGAGTDAWRGTSKGLSYTALPSPDSVSHGSPFAPGGGDTDLTVATAKNTSGNYNVYVASLSGANVDISTSTDRGNTWSLNPIGATIAGDDREWIAADGASKVCISYHDIATSNIIVNCSTDAGKTFTQVGQAFDTNHLFLTDDNMIGNLMIDPSNHYVYQTFSGIANANEASCTTCGNHVVYMAVSTDGGKNFTDNVVYANPDTTVNYGHQFVNVSIDKAGNVYSVYSDNHNLFYSYSTNHGTTWSAPVRVNSAPTSATAIMPWSVANNAGHIDIVWYGTSYYDGVNSPDNYPMSASWYVFFAQNLSATTHGSTFTQVQASPINHYGGVCESGVSCTGNRDLYDDFGIAVNPTTGLASIVYSDDQYTNDPNDPPQANCTPTTSNTSSCNHTSIASQTSGSGI